MEEHVPVASAGRDNPSDAPHEATMLFRQLLELSEGYTKFMGSALSVNDTDFKAMGALMEVGPMSAGDLAKSIGVSPAAATSVIDRLVASGHVAREPSKTDRRALLVVPNPASVEKAWAHLAPIIQASEGTIRDMDTRDQHAVLAYLRAMTDAFVQSSAESE